MKKFAFIALLYVFAFACLFEPARQLYERYDFWANGQDALMSSTDRTVHLAARSPADDYPVANVVYTPLSGAPFKLQKFLTREVILRLDRGERIPVRYLKTEPRRALYDNERTEVSWGFLFVGLVALAAGVFGHLLLRKELAASH